MSNKKYINVITDLVVASDLYKILSTYYNRGKIFEIFLYFMNYMDDCDKHKFVDFVFEYSMKLASKYPASIEILLELWGSRGYARPPSIDKKFRSVFNDIQYSDNFIDNLLDILDEINFPFMDINLIKIVKNNDPKLAILDRYRLFYDGVFGWLFQWLPRECSNKWTMSMRNLLIKCYNKISNAISKIYQEINSDNQSIHCEYIALSQAFYYYCLLNCYTTIKALWSNHDGMYIVSKDLLLIWLEMYIDYSVPLFLNYYKLTCDKLDKLEPVIHYYMNDRYPFFKIHHWLWYPSMKTEYDPLKAYLHCLFENNKEFFKEYMEWVNYITKKLPSPLLTSRINYETNIIYFISFIYELISRKLTSSEKKISLYINEYFKSFSTFYDLLIKYKKQFIEYTNNMDDIRVKILNAYA